MFSSSNSHIHTTRPIFIEPNVYTYYHIVDQCDTFICLRVPSFSLSLSWYGSQLAWKQFNYTVSYERRSEVKMTILIDAHFRLPSVTISFLLSNEIRYIIIEFSVPAKIESRIVAGSHRFSMPDIYTYKWICPRMVL